MALLGLAALGLLAVLSLSAWVRLAPDDPALWDAALDAASPASPGPCAAQIRAVPRGARAACLLPGAPGQVLAALDAIAQAAPRTQMLATGPGRITWVSRSRLMGYPDYITAQVMPTPQGTRLDVLSRQRYGNGDWGVNAARLQDWLSRL